MRIMGLLVVLLALSGCDNDSTPAGDDPGDGAGGVPDIGAPLDVQAGDLEADRLVFSWWVGGGFVSSAIEAFLAGRHGHVGVFVYGDGRVIVPDSLYDGAACRTYKTFTLSQDELQGLVDLADSSIAAADGKDYVACQVADAGTAVATVDLPGLKVRATAFPGFGDGEGASSMCGGPWEQGPPPASLLALVVALADLQDRATTPWAPELGVVVAGCAPGEGFLDDACKTAPEATWPVNVSALATGECFDAPDLATITAAAGDADEISSAIMSLHPQPLVTTIGGACVLVGCDAVLPHE
jgi:hypothetical protein